MTTRQSTILSHADQNIGSLNIQLNVVNQLNNTDQSTFDRSDIMRMLVEAERRLKEKQDNELNALAELAA